MFLFKELEGSYKSDDQVPSLNDDDSSVDDGSIESKCSEFHSLNIVSAEQLLDVEVAMAGVPVSLDILFDKDVWIADTGASNHGTYSDLGGKNT